MKYRILTTLDNTLRSLFSYSSSYIQSGLSRDECNLIDDIEINTWEEALNHICEKLNLKLISVYPAKDKNGFPRIIHIFEEIKDDKLLM